MIKTKLTYGDIFLVMVNLVPLAGVWFMAWEPKQMFLIYCVETIIIGIFNVIKMVISGFYKPKDVWENNGSKTMQPFWFFILFFIAHYGFFVFIQVNIFLSVSGMSDGMDFGFFTKIPSLLEDYSKLVLYIFFGMYGVKMFTDFINTGVYKTISIRYLMFQPYGRIFVQQFVVILGSIFLQFGAGKIFMLVFVLVKIYAEVFIDFERWLGRAMEKDKDGETKVVGPHDPAE